MTGLMVLIVILLIAMLLWMVGVTMVCYSLVKGLGAVKDYAETAVEAREDVLKDALNVFDTVTGLCSQINRKVDECAEATQRVIDETAKDKEFALKTIQATRRLQHEIIARCEEVTDEQTVSGTGEV